MTFNHLTKFFNSYFHPTNTFSNIPNGIYIKQPQISISKFSISNFQ
ncbi:MAG: hypothetical protein F6K15_00735 [Okeania sp. SIO2B3]|nr:hypothetical protein [Okeania sp. SIO2B3]